MSKKGYSQGVIRIVRAYQRRVGAQKVDPSMVSLRLAPFQGMLASDIQDVMSDNDDIQNEDKFVLGKTFLRMALPDADTFDNLLGSRGEAIEEGAYVGGSWDQSRIDKQLVSWEKFGRKLNKERARARQYIENAADPRYELLLGFLTQYYYNTVLNHIDAAMSWELPENVAVGLSKAVAKHNRKMSPLWREANETFAGSLDSYLYKMKGEIEEFVDSRRRTWAYPQDWKELSRWVQQDFRKQKKSITKWAGKIWSSYKASRHA